MVGSSCALTLAEAASWALGQFADASLPYRRLKNDSFK
jgi:hypothetical protein